MKFKTLLFFTIPIFLYSNSFCQQLENRCSKSEINQKQIEIFSYFLDCTVAMKKYLIHEDLIYLGKSYAYFSIADSLAKDLLVYCDSLKNTEFPKFLELNRKLLNRNRKELENDSNIGSLKNVEIEGNIIKISEQQMVYLTQILGVEISFEICIEVLKSGKILF